MAGCAKYLSNLWGYPCRVSAPCVRDEAIVGLLLLRGVWGGSFSSGNADNAPSRTVPWGTQWGQLNRLLAALVPWVLSRWAAGAAFCGYLLGTFRSLRGVVPARLVRLGLGLLPG